MELESASTLSIHPSQHGTVILNTCGLSWAEASAKLTNDTTGEPSQSLSKEMVTEDVPVSQDSVSPLTGHGIKSSPSIRPSQSASQCGPHHGVLNERGAVSRYFLSQHNGTSLEVPESSKISPAAVMLYPQPTLPDSIMKTGSPDQHAFLLEAPTIPIPKRVPRVRSPCDYEDLNSITLTRPPPVSSPNSLQLIVRDLEATHCLDTTAIYPVNAKASLIHGFSNLVTDCYYDDDLDIWPDAIENKGYLNSERPGQELTGEFDGLDPMNFTSDKTRFHDMTDDDDIISQSDEEDNGSAENLANFQDRDPEDHHHLYTTQDLGFSRGADIYWPSSQQVVAQMNSRPGTGYSWLSSGDASHSSGSQDDPTLRFEQFCQGRTLLQGTARRDGERLPLVSQAEADVATSLKGHWQPRRH